MVRGCHGGWPIFKEKSWQLIQSHSIAFIFVSLPILAHSINIYSFHSILISDLNVRATRKGVALPSNMDTTCFHSLENISFEPLQWLGLYYYLVDLCHNVCFSLWDTSLLWKLCFHWIQDVFIKRQHVHLSCLSWSRSTCLSYVISLGTVNHDILGPLQLISLQTVSRKLIFFFWSWQARHGGPLYVCLLNRFSKCLCFVVIAISNNHV